MTDVYSYRTISTAVTSLIKEKGSKFYGFAFPVTNEEEIKTHLEELRNLHPKATHHCYAWRLGSDGHQFRANDDGEPTNTAGKPILGQIDAFEITNCLIVSIRYFGGTKLGVSGLITAYKNSAKETLNLAVVLELELYKPFKISCTYDVMNLTFQCIQQFEGNILKQDLNEKCIWLIEIPARNYQSLLDSKENFYPIEINEIK
ncbi:MAG TPA: YigZ family protein [Chitinophagales bacterium]|nr:YigZ family protein [Chitinophagales bacterium]